MTKEEIIKKYKRIPLDREGGMWAAMYRSDESLPENVIPGRQGSHNLYGSILYLLTPGSVSRMHRLASDEIWHFYQGASCELLMLRPDGSGEAVRLGADIAGGDELTFMVPRGCWQGCRMTGEGDYALLGTTMAPAYEDVDYEDGTEALLEEYPEFADKILPLLARP